VLGPGTGLGVAGLLRGPRGTWLPVVGEGGHATLCAVDAVEEELLAILRRRWPHVSAERVLSGSGLVNLHRAHGERTGETIEGLAPADIVSRALDGSDRRCVETLERFLGFLGSFAGNLALTLGAQGGVYIGGGIVPRLGDRIAASCFRERFESKGRFRTYLARLPAQGDSPGDRP
jgi:glucokinase